MIRTAPRGAFQREAVERALAHDGFLVFAEQRTGKCWISLSVVDRRKPDHLWILCPIQAIKTWKQQIATHLKVDWDCQLTVINYEELFARKRQYFREAKKLKNLMIIGDELHKIKRRGSKQGRAARTLAKRARWKLGLTGTPLAQGLQDGWALYDFVDPTVFGPWSSKYDKKTGMRTHEGFEDRYLVYGGFGGFKIVGYRNEKEFQEKFHSRSFRVTLREARGKDRPLSLRHQKIWFDLDPETREFYDELERELIATVNRKNIKKIVRVRAVVALTMKLQQIAGGFVIDEEKEVHQVGTEALRRLRPIVIDLHQAREKFVVVCRFIHEVKAIERRFERWGITSKLVIGGQPYDNRFDTDAIIIQVQSGVAVDMAMASHTIFYSSDFSYINYEQMKFRTLDFDKPWASFYYLLARDTIAELVYQAVRRKKNLAQLVLDKYRKQKHVRTS